MACENPASAIPKGSSFEAFHEPDLSWGNICKIDWLNKN